MFRSPRQLIEQLNFEEKKSISTLKVVGFKLLNFFGGCLICHQNLKGELVLTRCQLAPMIGVAVTLEILQKNLSQLVGRLFQRIFFG